MTSQIANPAKPRPVIMETARLYLRPCKWADLQALHDLWTEPQVRKYLWDDVIIPRKTAAKIIRRSIADFRKSGFGQWTIFLRNQKELIGFCGFRFVENSTDVEILYGFFSSFWKQGYAVEAASAVLKYGFEECRFQQIFGRTDVPNVASVKVLERLRMTFVARERVNNLDTLKYSMTRQQFEAINNER